MAKYNFNYTGKSVTVFLFFLRVLRLQMCQMVEFCYGKSTTTAYFRQSRKSEDEQQRKKAAHLKCLINFKNLPFHNLPRQGVEGAFTRS